MPRPLSSPLTFVWKFSVPTLFIAGACYVIVVQWLDKFRNRDGMPLSNAEFGLALMFNIAISAWVIWYTKRFKRIAVDDRALYVSNYWSEISIPLTEVCDLKETTGDRRYFSVTIHLRKPSIFGQRILFRPRFRFYWSGVHPVILELEALCASARSQEGGDREIR